MHDANFCACGAELKSIIVVDDFDFAPEQLAFHNLMQIQQRAHVFLADADFIPTTDNVSTNTENSLGFRTRRVDAEVRPSNFSEDWKLCAVHSPETHDVEVSLSFHSHAWSCVFQHAHSLSTCRHHCPQSLSLRALTNARRNHRLFSYCPVLTPFIPSCLL